MPRHELYTIKRTATPLRQAPWVIENNLVIIQTPKFYGKLGKAFCRLIRRPPHIDLHLDDLGSLVWKKCDGKHTVNDMIEYVIGKYNLPQEKVHDEIARFLSGLAEKKLVSFG